MPLEAASSTNFTRLTAMSTQAKAARKIAGAISQIYPGKAEIAMNKLLAGLQDENLRRQAEDILR